MFQAYEKESSDEKISILQDKISQLEDIVRNIRDVLVNIAADVGEEETEGNNFRVKNIPAIKEDSRLLGLLENR